MSKNGELIFNSEFLETLPYETPYFLFSKAKILKNYHEFKTLFPGSAIHFAMKSNSEPDVLKVLKEVDSGFEVASIYELEMLKKIHVPADRILYGSSVKPASHIKLFSKYGVNRY